MLEQCGACGTRFAAGLPACPHCWHPAGEPAADDGQGDDSDDEEADVAKITKSGVSFPADAAEPVAEPFELAPEAEAASEPVTAAGDAPEPAEADPGPGAAESREPPPPPPPPSEAADG